MASICCNPSNPGPPAYTAPYVTDCAAKSGLFLYHKIKLDNYDTEFTFVCKYFLSGFGISLLKSFNADTNLTFKPYNIFYTYAALGGHGAGFSNWIYFGSKVKFLNCGSWMISSKFSTDTIYVYDFASVVVMFYYYFLNFLKKLSNTVYISRSVTICPSFGCWYLTYCISNYLYSTNI